jgi:hypothetical protein
MEGCRSGLTTLFAKQMVLNRTHRFESYTFRQAFLYLQVIDLIKVLGVCLSIGV